jgi:excinuclease ABC subunit A
MVKVEMHFCPTEVYVPCDVWHTTGRRWRCSTRARTLRKFELTVEAAHEFFFKAVPTIARKLHTLLDVGLIHPLKQSATTLPWRSSTRQTGARTVQTRHRAHVTS